MHRSSVPLILRIAKRVAVVAVCNQLLACGGGAVESYKVVSFQVETHEDTSVEGQVSAVGANGPSSSFAVATPPARGSVFLDKKSGTFTYTPHLDANGSDGFTIIATSADGTRSAPGRVSLHIAPVNDAPVIQMIADKANQPEQLNARVKLQASDADGDLLEVAVRSDDPQVATVVYEPASGEVVLSASGPGRSQIQITVTDGRQIAHRSFSFDVAEFTRRAVLSSQRPEYEGVVIENRSGRSSQFVLEHNGEPVFKDADHAIRHVQSLSDEVPGEGFERKLWRYIRDATVHFTPLMPLQFRHAPWGTLNSIGFGYCGDMATSYVALARAAGFEARVWSLGGHVVAEIHARGRWQMYDPDLGVYYHNRQGDVAGVDELAADPALVNHPLRPVVADPAARPYTQAAATIYASTLDNWVADSTLLPSLPDIQGTFDMPSGAKLTYPGRWTEPPAAYVAFAENILFEADLPNWRAQAQRYDNATSYAAPFHGQARMDLPDGYAGKIPLPLWLWDIQGQGRVRIDNIDYQVGSAELTERLRYRMPVRALTVLNSTGLGLVMQINFLRFGMRASNTVSVMGRDVGALDIRTENLGAHQAGQAWTWINRRPMGVN